MQGGSVVKVEEEEETSLYGNDGWLRVAARVCVCVCGVGGERYNREIKGE